jgi:hypothetical protein
MGRIGEGIAEYAQPLVDQTDGSPAQVEKALTIAMFCWNLAVVEDSLHEELLGEMRTATSMGDEEWAAFRRDIIAPMVRRHREMFPGMGPRRGPATPPMISNGPRRR